MTAGAICQKEDRTGFSGLMQQTQYCLGTGELDWGIRFRDCWVTQQSPVQSKTGSCIRFMKNPNSPGLPPKPNGCSSGTSDWGV